MAAQSRGRPHASSREVLADAACELFLEQGYDATSIVDITRRAGVSRSSFFNYFEAKPSILWFVFDEHVAKLEAALAAGQQPLAQALAGFGEGSPPDSLALAIVDARNMGVESELQIGRAVRQLRIAEAIAERLVRAGEGRLRAEVLAAGHAAALVGAVWSWALQGAGRHSLSQLVSEAVAVSAELLGPRD